MMAVSPRMRNALTLFSSVDDVLCDRVRLVTPADPRRRAGVVAIAPRDPEGASARLTDAGVIHSLREGAIRLSPHFYNTEAEVDRAIEVLAR